ncbi:YopX family protein [Lysinibacillus sphaericus]|uniref:YopX family protein n=1 Tax=Lysinibacillus sphaericus TaxID=1421 RepID=UPI0018CEB64E|nr:YopX family protein [Lysinibacillus sphaericus]MBG9756380.1 hypothetical protein [Lysinibacillus sphaericus]QTB12598.1 hypothetical protein J2B92_17300 [Lysinibacillus sphaericus]
MREIKFRVWDKDLKKMHICGENQHDSIIFLENQACYYNLQNGEGSSSDGTGTYDLMQCTGLKDSRNVEIYETDIVKVEIPVVSVNEDFIGRVKMLEGRWWVDNGNDAIPLWSEINEITVLGNIYENPELMEEPS